MKSLKDKIQDSNIGYCYDNLDVKQAILEFKKLFEEMRKTEKFDWDILETYEIAYNEIFGEFEK